MPDPFHLLQLPHLGPQGIRRRHVFLPSDQIPPQLVPHPQVRTQGRGQFAQHLRLLPLLRRLIQHLHLPVQTQLRSKTPHHPVKKTVQGAHFQAI